MEIWFKSNNTFLLAATDMWLVKKGCINIFVSVKHLNMNLHFDEVSQKLYTMLFISIKTTGLQINTIAPFY